MENILNKALSEVLTPRYSEELRDAFDTGYKFSPEFENKMRELIRKTDRPVTKYIGYMAAAACAVIAIGCAMIVPAIMNSNIDTKPAENTVSGETTTISEPPETSGTEPSATETSITEKSVTETSVTTSQTTSDTPDLNIGIPSVIEEDDTVLTEPSAPESDNAAGGTDIPDNTEGIAEEGTVSGTSETADPAPVVADNEVQIVEQDGDINVTASDDTGYVNIVDNTDDTEEVVEDEAECDLPDSDDDAVILDNGDYYIDETTTVEVNNGDNLGEVMKEIMPGFDFNNVFAASAGYSPTGTLQNAKNQTENLNFHRFEYPFIQDFVHSLGSAVANNDGYADADGIKKLKLYIRDTGTVVTDYSDYGQNVSAWKNYDTWFNVDENDVEEEFDDDIEPIEQVTKDIMTVIVSSTGRVEVQGSYVVSDTSEGKTYLYQLSNVRFEMDAETVNTLFAALEKAHLSETAQTVGDIKDSMAVTADNISQAYISVHSIYDTDLYHVKIGYDFIEDLLEAHRSDKVKKVLSNQLTELEEPNGEVYVEFYTKDGAHITVYIDTGYITDQFVGYKYAVSGSDIGNTLDAVEKANGFIIPRYSYLGEYLSDKHFDKLRYVTFSGSKDGEDGSFNLTDESELNNVIEFLRNEFENAEYIPFMKPIGRGRKVDIYVQVEGYWSYIHFYENDVAEFWAGNDRSAFRMTSGAIQRLKQLLTGCASAQFTSNVQEEEWEELIDDVDEDAVTEEIAG